MGGGGTKKPLIIAHRGASYELPGNTLPSIHRAIKDGADMIEVDLRRTNDGVIILSHNECHFSLEELKERYKGHKLPFCPPTLEEVLREVPKSTVFYFDIKEFGIAQDLKKIVRKYEMEEAWYSNKQSLIYAYTPLLYCDPFVPVTLYGVSGKKMACFIPERACIYYYEHVPSLVRLAHLLGRKLWVWGVNTKYEMEKWVRLGVDGILTDRPEVLKNITNKIISNI